MRYREQAQRMYNLTRMLNPTEDFSCYERGSETERVFSYRGKVFKVIKGLKENPSYEDKLRFHLRKVLLLQKEYISKRFSVLVPFEFNEECMVVIQDMIEGIRHSYEMYTDIVHDILRQEGAYYRGTCFIGDLHEDNVVYTEDGYKIIDYRIEHSEPAWVHYIKSHPYLRNLEQERLALKKAISDDFKRRFP